jgi:hypothetical protein
MSSLLERHGDKIRGVMSCFDRVVIHGTLPGICSADGMTSYLHRHAIRIFDYPHFAQGLRDEAPLRPCAFALRIPARFAQDFTTTDQAGGAGTKMRARRWSGLRRLSCWLLAIGC